MSLLLAAALLAVVLLFAMIRPHGWPEAVVAAPAAGLLILTGIVGTAEAGAVIGELAPVVGFLAAVLVLARLCDDEGLFQAAGAAMARLAAGDPRRLLAGVFLLAAATTAVLSLDATVLLLTPVVLATARTMSVPARPHAYATAHLANSASLLLPVSNLTNLLAFSAAGVSFAHFAAIMALPWLAVLAVEFAVLRLLFAAEVRPGPPAGTPAPPAEVPVFVLAVLGCTLAGFVVTSGYGLSPAWAALAGAGVLGVRSVAQKRSTVSGMVAAADIPFLVFVLCLGVVVHAVVTHGLGEAMNRLVPDGTSLPALLAITGIAALLANVVNNLPAVLVLLPVVSASGPAAVLAVLIGVNIGPNLTYPGSLANLLWRGVVHRDGMRARFTEFSLVGLCTTPPALVAAVLCLWVVTR